jgi:hypothetical protein
MRIPTWGLGRDEETRDKRRWDLSTVEADWSQERGQSRTKRRQLHSVSSLMTVSAMLQRCLFVGGQCLGCMDPTQRLKKNLAGSRLTAQAHWPQALRGAGRAGARLCRSRGDGKARFVRLGQQPQVARYSRLASCQSLCGQMRGRSTVGIAMITYLSSTYRVGALPG